MTVMVTLQAANGDTARVPLADNYPGYAGWTIIAQEDWPTLAMLKADRHEAVKALRSAKEAATCATPSGTVQIDDSSKIKINGLATMATIAKANALAFNVDFIMADNSVVTLTADAAIAMSMAVGTYVSGLYGNSAALFASIDAAADATALAAIDITTGWP